MNPDTFRTAAIAWLGVLAVILPIATGVVVKLIMSVAQVRQTFRDAQGDLIRRQDAQSRHLISQQEQITGIAKALPPPAAAPPAPPVPATDPLSSSDHPAPPDARP